jgi:FAD-dependent urate hydroxylase
VADRLDVAVIGAGPFGLSVAAHLARRRVRAFGRPMETWRTRMPPDMRLRSDWDETNLSAPQDRGSIDAWAKAVGEPREEPIPLQKFLRYADWFRETLVPENDPSDVAQLERGGGVFRVTTAAGGEADARDVVLAVGVTPFPHAPPPFDAFIGDGVAFAIDRQDYDAYRGRRVIVVGGGQGGLEAAALARRAGADVEIIIRSQLRWFTDREPYRPRGRLQQRLYRVAYPVVGYGPPPLNRLALHPDAFAAVPAPARRAVARRILCAGGSPWVLG